mmetsp:Transcript_24988/g.66183  ORF Transcript_24988/g.66183 Transcript_24988/m.66183 type:complete len:308 (+) Transcript_24988:1159-2082(+)
MERFYPAISTAGIEHIARLREARDAIVAHRQSCSKHLGLQGEDAHVSCSCSCKQEAVFHDAADMFSLQARRRELDSIAAKRIAHGLNVKAHHVDENLAVVRGAQLVARVAPSGRIFQNRAPHSKGARTLRPSGINHFGGGDVPDENHLIPARGYQKSSIRRKLHTEDRVRKASELRILLAIVEVPDHDRRHCSLSPGRAQLARGNELAVGRNIQGGNLVVVAMKELLLVRIVDVLHNDGSSSGVDQRLSLQRVVPDGVQVLATIAAEVFQLGHARHGPSPLGTRAPHPRMQGCPSGRPEGAAPGAVS